jgi:hypothetical protein
MVWGVMRRLFRRLFKGVGATLLAVFIAGMSALLGSSYCLCVEDYDNCGTAHCDCFEDVSDAGCAESGADGCADITIDVLDALLDGHTLKLVAVPAMMASPLVVCEEVSCAALLRGGLPPPTAPPWPPSHYLSTSHRLYPRS